MLKRAVAGTRFYWDARAATAGASTNSWVANGQLLMQLHRWEIAHDHGPIGNPQLAHGNGVLLWFEVEDFEAAVVRAQQLGAEVVLPRHRNPPEGDGGPNHWEIWLRDLDGYTVDLASPYGTADGNWKPPEGGPFRGR